MIYILNKKYAAEIIFCFKKQYLFKDIRFHEFALFRLGYTYRKKYANSEKLSYFICG
jgi:hypothetical protein